MQNPVSSYTVAGTMLELRGVIESIAWQVRSPGLEL